MFSLECCRPASRTSVTNHDQRRSLVARGSIIDVFRRVEERVRSKAFLGRKLEPTWQREVARVDFNFARSPENRRLSRGEIELNNRLRLGWRTAAKQNAARRNSQA